MLNSRVMGASLHRVRIDADKAIICRTFVSTIGSGPSLFTESLQLPMIRGKVKVDSMLRVAGYPNVWTLGDMAAVPLPTGELTPPTAQFAIRQAKLLAANLLRLEMGKDLQPFDHHPLGMMASLGSYRAVASVGSFKIHGLIAWLLWRFFYIALLPGISTRVRVGLNWLFDYFLPRNLVHMNTPNIGGCGKRLFEAGDVLFSPGQFVDGFYVVIRGRLRYSRMHDSEVLFTRDYCAGDCWGEGVLGHGNTISGEMQAAEATEVLVMNATDYAMLLDSLPGFSQAYSANDA
jgi:NADH dehydrogenase